MEDFGKYLSVPYASERIRQGYTRYWNDYEKHKYYFSISCLTEHGIFNKRACNSGTTPNRLILYSSYLSISDRMLHYFIAYLLMPKHSNDSQINDTKMKLIYIVKNKLKVNWAYEIIHHMHHQRGLIGGLPLARLITKIIKFCGVDLTGEPTKKILLRTVR